MRKHLQTLFLFSVLSFLFTVSSVAQVTTASISGKVVYEDEPVIGATVVAIHEPSGTRYGTVTNIDGRYTLPNMRAGGPYKVDISYGGYQPIAFTNISLNLGDNYALNASLKESSELLEEVVVIGSSNSNMKSDRAGAITSITREGIEAIPTISRSMNDIMRMSPQSSTTTNGFAVGGGNYR